MMDDFFYTYESDDYRQMPGISNIRLLHAAPGAPAVDVYANNRLIARRLTYGRFTEYMPLDAGTYTIEIYPTGMKDLHILRANLTFTDSKVFTIAVIGILPKIGILPVEDEYEQVSPNRVNIRFANLAPKSPGLDFVMRDGPTLFSDVNYTEVSDYRSLSPGDYHFYIRPSMTGFNVVYVPARLLPRRNLTFYLLGDYDIPTSLAVYIPMDGTTYLRG